MENNTKNKSKKRQSSRKKRKNSSSDGKENTPKNKKIKDKKCSSADGIGMSKQLAIKMSQKVVTKRRSIKETKNCLNGKPMPSLADLEKMYEDTDNEEVSSPKPEPETPQTPIKLNTADDNQLLSPNTVSKISARMLEIISNADPAELFAHIPLPSGEPPPPIIPTKKRKKSDTAYIVGCKDRPQVPYNPCTTFCKGDSDYGVDTNIIHTVGEVDQFLNKRRKKSGIGGFSKSIFNAHSEEIADNLKRISEKDRSCDSSKTEDYAFKPFVPVNPVSEMLKSTENDSDDSFDSSKTVDYFAAKKVTDNKKSSSDIDMSNKKTVDLNISVTSNGKPVPFSPLPSTSRDNETFIKNDQLFNESLTATSTICETEYTQGDKLLIKNHEDEIEETQDEKVLFKTDALYDEPLPVNSTIHDLTEEQNDNDVQIVEIPCETIIVNDEETKHTGRTKIIRSLNRKSLDDLNDDDCVILVDNNTLENKKAVNENWTTIIIDDEYSNIYNDDSYRGDVDEIIDIDSLIEENEAIIKKIDGTKRFDSIIEVVDIPNTPSPGVQQTEPQNNSDISENTTNFSGPCNIGPRSIISMYGNTAAEHNYSELTVPGAGVTSTVNNSQEANLSAHTENTNTIGNIVADFFKRSHILNATNNVFSRIDNLISTLDCLLPNNTSESNSSQTQFPDNTNFLHDSSLDLSPLYTYISDYVESYAPIQVAESNLHKNKKTPKMSKTQTANKNLSAGTDTAEKGTRNIGDCPICMDSLSNNTIASTICGHVFCLVCIKAAIRSSGKRCPTCRKVLKGVGYHQLYL